MSPTTLTRETRRKRVVKRKTNKMSRMTQSDFKEMNEVTKKGRGLSNLTLKDIFGEDNA